MNPYAERDVANRVAHGNIHNPLLIVIARIRDDSVRQQLADALRNGVASKARAEKLLQKVHICPRAQIGDADLQSIQEGLQFKS